MGAGAGDEHGEQAADGDVCGHDVEGPQGARGRDEPAVTVAVAFEIGDHQRPKPVVAISPRSIRRMSHTAWSFASDEASSVSIGSRERRTPRSVRL
ncbi:hypothetical protein [Microbacterium aurantiacum]|uniref:hypothetical protein n=1 Tax=Microbacterium aurantiacum TaxID=162393 RepID=UPI0007DA9963|nr:hypothetical protein [Microbacterium chocolatum]ANG86465.1 hypothetical protein A8L33_00005 [Microbacterium chocolatum]